MTQAVVPIPETPESVYGILSTHQDDQSFLRSAFFKARCPSLPQFVELPEALEAAGLTNNGQMLDHVADVVKAYVQNDSEFWMSLAPLETYNPATP